MKNIAIIFTVITCVLHFYFLILEMFLWRTPYGLRVFGMTSEAARSSAVLAANQGVYNGLLAAGLFLSFFLTDATTALAIRHYCLWFIVIVGCYGWYSLSFKIFLVQSLPAIIALAAAYL